MRSQVSLHAGLALALLAAGCSRGASSPPAAPGGPPVVVHVLSAAPHAGAPLVLPARVTAREEVTITARLAARLTALPCREGDRFARGATLARFEAPETRAALESARAGLAAAALQRDLARTQEARMDSLFAAHVAARRELEGAQAERRATEAGWAQARAQLDQMSSGVEIQAPFDGVVVRRHADVGATVGPGQPLLDIRTTGPGEITAPVPESELGRLEGGKAEVQVEGGAWRAATLVRLDGMTDFATRSRVARFRLEGGAALDPGAFVRVRLSSGAADSSAAGSAPLTVPAGALVRRGGLTGVFVAEDGVARLRWLRVGHEAGASAEVLAGLEPQDQVIADPQGLEDGRLVQVGR